MKNEKILSENDKNALYLYVKCIETMIYCKDLDDFLKNFDKFFVVDPRTVINVLEIFIISNINNIDKYSQKNAYETLNFFKEKLENKDKMQEKINTIVRLINCSNANKIRSFLKTEYKNRFLDDRIANKAVRYPEESLETLRKLIIIDFNILINHSSFNDDETFEELIDSCVQNDIMYLGSINIITKENPLILKDKIFKNRVKQVLQKMNTKNKKIKRLYNKSKKKLGI